MSNNKNNENYENEKQNYNKTITAQSNQMIELINISNAWSRQSDKLTKDLHESHNNCKMLEDNTSKFKHLFVLQNLLFILLILILLWMNKE